MSFHLLPVELLDDIAHNLDSNALVALSRTCTSLSPVVRRLLYRNVSASAWSKNLSIVITLAKKPHIACFVRSFSIVIDPRTPAFASYYRLLADALYNMAELTSLNLLVDSNVSWILNGAERRVSYPYLSHFTSSFPFDHNIAAFLRKTPSLQELEVDSMPTTPFARSGPLPSLPSAAIPRLSQFTGSSRTAKLIVPGRPVTSIHLNAGSLTEDDILYLAQSSACVAVLGAVTTMPPVPFLEFLHKHMPHLAYLRMIQNLFKTPSAAFYEQVANALAAFPDLTAFELSGMHWGSQRKDEQGKRRWQSAPLTIEMTHDDDIAIDTEIFFGY